MSAELSYVLYYGFAYEHPQNPTEKKFGRRLDEPVARAEVYRIAEAFAESERNALRIAE